MRAAIRMRTGLALAAVLMSAVAGCSDTVPMAPLNQQAQAVGSPRLDYFVGVPGGPMKVTMPNGEILPGTFTISETATTPDPEGGNFRATAHGPRTTLVCHANLVGGHGVGECRAQDGAAYRLQL